MWPVRTGVLVESGQAYFGAALVPWRESFLCAVDAETGKAEGDGHFRQGLKSVTMEGALLASSRNSTCRKAVAPRWYSIGPTGSAWEISRVAEGCS